MECREENCQNAPAFTFVWSWGITEAVCAEHAPLAQQAAANLGTSLTLHPVGVTIPAPPPDVVECLARVDELKGEVHELELERAHLRETVLDAAEILKLKDAELANFSARIHAARAELESECDQVPDALDLTKPWPPEQVCEGGEAP